MSSSGSRPARDPGFRKARSSEPRDKSRANASSPPSWLLGNTVTVTSPLVRSPTSRANSLLALSTGLSMANTWPSRSFSSAACAEPGAMINATNPSAQASAPRFRVFVMLVSVRYRSYVRPPPGGPRSMVVDDDGLGHRVLAQRLEPLFAAMAAALEPSKRQLDAPTCAVTAEVHLAAAQPLGQPHLARAVLAPNAGDQAVVGSVGDAHRVVFVVERYCGKHRAEHLLARQFVIERHRPEQR